MRYLGHISGKGVLKWKGQDVGPAAFDFDGFFKNPFGVMCSGEIRLLPPALRAVFGHRGVQLLTDEGRLLDIRFSGKELPSESDSAHVDVTGDLPKTPRTWQH
jgi:hypothetical protein